MKDFVTSLSGKDYTEANSLIQQISGIVDFFNSNEEKDLFIADDIASNQLACEEQSTYGDWQTPPSLALQICKNHLLKFGQPDIVIEPTCGLGTFVIAALDVFPNVKKIYAIEINSGYVDRLKKRLLHNSLAFPRSENPEIHIYNADFFSFDFSDIVKQCIANNSKFSIIGNPPWVTNSHQGMMGSLNLPQKHNGYGLSGIDAITGKSNFDISESITLSLLRTFLKCEGSISFLLKNSVIRNIISKQPANNFLIGDVQQAKINASREFNVSVEASCLSASIGSIISKKCDVIDFYTKKYISSYGWVDNRFTSDLASYKKYSHFDGSSTYVWRSGIKHDCATILELNLENGIYTNGLNETVDVEEDFIYPLLKSSDLQKTDIEVRKFVIVPLKKPGQDSSCLKKFAPKLYDYLVHHADAFKKRKSSIYRGKDPFSIFGIGDYTFMPYKIIVSSLYKIPKFRLIAPYKGKPVIVDDTCYQLDFNSRDEASAIFEALNSEEIQSLLKSMSFTDSKRVITKTLLMRLNLLEYCNYKGIINNSGSQCGRWVQQLTLFE